MLLCQTVGDSDGTAHVGQHQLGNVCITQSAKQKTAAVFGGDLGHRSSAGTVKDRGHLNSSTPNFVRLHHHPFLLHFFLFFFVFFVFFVFFFRSLSLPFVSCKPFSSRLN
jgi:hypothetical protein